VNLAIADRTGEQLDPKIHATSDGGCYVSWFDDSAGGYDPYLQRLDPDGNELWAHNGVLVADRSLAYAQHYGLDVDADDNALLAFRDDRFGGEQVTAAKVSPEGELLWGANGVQLGEVDQLIESPKIAATTDGYVVVGWTVNHGEQTDVRFQRLDASGVAQWEHVLVLTPATGSYGRVTLHASDGGAVIAAWIKEGPTYCDPRHVYAQKISATGDTLWGSSPLIVFEDGSLPYGCFPHFVPDGSGGAAFGWYRIDPSYDCYAQHILADGTEAFGHNGALASTLATQKHVEPAVCFDPGTSATFLFWVEANAAQTEFGICGQRFDASGVRQWLDEGLAFVPLSGNQVREICNLQYADGALVFWIETVRIGIDHVVATRVDGTGDFVWGSSFATVSSPESNKQALCATLGTQQDALLVWMDDRDDFSDVYGQNIVEDGSLGGDAIEIVFLDPPTGPPPEMLCDCEMMPFFEDPRPVYEDVESVPSPCEAGGDILFSIPLNHRTVPDSWMAWSHGYTGDVYYTNNADEVTLTLPPGSCGFYFYVQPSEWLLADFQVTVNDTVYSEV